MRLALLVSSLLLAVGLHAENIDETLSGFDDEPMTETTSTANDIQDGFDEDDTKPRLMKSSEEEGFFTNLFSDFSGKITQEGAISYNDLRPQNIFGSLRQSFFLYYEHSFENGVKVKVNGRAFYDPMYDTSKAVDYYPAEIAELNSEVELFEAYVEGSINENLDARLGRQVVIWGKSDTIRVTDILNPIDNRRPGYQDLESLYLPTTMLKFDYQYDNWRISPIVILEQRFTKDPPLGSVFHPASPEETYSDYIAAGNTVYSVEHESYKDPTFALSIGGEFEGWDINFYAARVYEARGYIPNDELLDPRIINKKFQHNKTNMLGAAFNIVEGEWLFKAELAYFDNLTYTTEQDDGLKRIDYLLGFEYAGFANTTFSYDFALRHFTEADLNLEVPLENYNGQDTYQHALRVSSSFKRDTLDANYLVSLYGKNLDEGGYQRAWIDYDMADALNTQFGVIDYFGGSLLFDKVADQVVVFMDISYSF